MLSLLASGSRKNLPVPGIRISPVYLPLCQSQPSVSISPLCCLLVLITPMCDQGGRGSSSTSCQVIPLHWSHDRMLAFVVGLRVLFHKAVGSDAVCFLGDLQDGRGSEVVGGGQLTLHNVTT